MRSHVVMAGAAAFVVSLFAPGAMAQDAQKLYQAYKEASAKVKAVSYTATTISAGGPRSVPVISGKVILTTDLKDREDFRGKFIITGERPAAPGAADAAAPAKFELGFDGKVIRNVINAEKVVEEVKVVSNDVVPYFEEPMMLLAFNYWHDEDIYQEPGAIKHAGQAEVGGVKCDVLIIERSFDIPAMDEDEEAKPDAKKPEPQKMVMKTRVHLGAEDHLLRKYEQSEPNTDTYAFGLMMTEVKADPTLEPTAFTVKTPEGYTVREKKLDEMGGEPEPKFKVGDVAAEWTLKDGDGKEHKLSDYKGKVVLMDFWAVWCQPCKMAMPGLQKLHESLKDKGVVVVGVSLDDDGAEAVKFMTKKKYTYLGLVDGKDVAQAYGIGPIPQFYVIGVDGKVIHHAIGFDPKNEKKLEEVIVKHLEEKGKN